MEQSETTQYDDMKINDLRREARKRGLSPGGSKVALKQRLLVDDEETKRVESEPVKAPDPDRWRVIRTKPTESNPAGQIFKICKACDKWDVRCDCDNGEVAKKPRQNRSASVAVPSETSARNGQNKRPGSHIHRGTFA